MNERSGLAQILEAAWGVRDQRTRRRQRGLSLDLIVNAAVRIASTEGLSAVSMTRVAGDMGVSPMSLYRYVQAKDELLILMADAVYAVPPEPVEPAAGWREGLCNWAWGLHRLLREHPWVLRIPITGPPATPHQVLWLERGLASLAGTRLTETEKLSVMMLINGFVRSEALLFSEVSQAFSGSGSQEAMSFYSSLLGKLASSDQFPFVHAALSAGGYDEESGPDDEFEFGLRCVLDGIEQLVERGRATA
ncbi:TetR/AcrR family transcriptional regulator [Streptomyces cinerochromogenes]|uniref:TetR/AcrR family transcriptional regulator n=1 Tax=Streptomyces cinerochromogenes TaxID=66422 RepID=UPI0033AABE50